MIVVSSASRIFEALAMRGLLHVIAAASALELNFVRDCGGNGDGGSLNDAAWAACLARIAASSGGTIFVPAGTYLSAPFNITTSATTLVLGGGATLRATTDEARWPLVLPLPSLGSCREFPEAYLRYSAFLTVWNATDVRITSNASAGEAPGALYGDGPVWWARRSAKTLGRDPGALLELMYAERVEVDHISILMSPYYHVHPFASAFLHFHDLRIDSLHSGGETDGLDPDSSHDVVIERVTIDTGDDAIAVKSGWDQPGIDFARPSYNILVRDSYLSTGANAFCMGSEMSGGIYNVTAVNVSCVDVDTCFRLKSALGRGGEIRDIFMYNSTIVGAKTAIEASDFYGGHPAGPVNSSLVPRVGHVLISGLKGILVEAAGAFAGLNNSNISSVALEDIDLDAPAGSWSCSHADGSSRNVKPLPCAELRG
jgi:polygalacturonase